MEWRVSSRGVNCLYLSPKCIWICRLYSNHLGVNMLSSLRSVELFKSLVWFLECLVVCLRSGFRFFRMVRGSFYFATTNWIFVIMKGCTQLCGGKFHHPNLLSKLILQIVNEHSLKIIIGNSNVDLWVKQLIMIDKVSDLIIFLLTFH